MKTLENKNTILVIFGKDFPTKCVDENSFDVIISESFFKKDIETLGSSFIDLDTLTSPGNIKDASLFAEELSKMTLPDGKRISKSFVYKGYELWWVRYDSLFTYFCLPYTQYKNLLEYLKSFKNIYIYKSPFASLFSCYLKSYGCDYNVIREQRSKILITLPFGIFLQIILTIIYIPILVIRKNSTMLFTGDKFDKDKDYDFRMKFIYEELRERNLAFVEFIRSLESWKTILKHAWVRKRPVIYSEAVAFAGRFISIILGGHRRARRRYGAYNFSSKIDQDKKFKLLVANQYLFTVYDDVWAIRIMTLILRIISVRSSIIPATLERNFHTVLGCKLNKIPIVGILHGVASRHYNMYDFMPGFDGSKMLSVDKYGLWSEWWKEYYIKNSKAYKPEQLFVSGPMRPIQRQVINSNKSISVNRQKINVLLISEIVAMPTEVMPYLDALNKTENFSVYIKFRPSNDGFEKWLIENRSDILNTFGEDRVLKGSMYEAIKLCDVVVGSQSTGVIESTLQLKPFVLFNTKKWGDYFDMRSFDSKYNFFAENPEELISHIRASGKIPNEVLKDLQERFFGDPCKNGSKWVVDQLEKFLP